MLFTPGLTFCLEIFENYKTKYDYDLSTSLDQSWAILQSLGQLLPYQIGHQYMY